jgi:hypothetical protein
MSRRLGARQPERVGDRVREITRALVAAGRKVDIAGLDGPIGLLCAKSLDLSPEDGRQMRVLLLGILEEVDALSELLRTTTTDTPPQA